MKELMALKNSLATHNILETHTMFHIIKEEKYKEFRDFVALKL
jgi:hypothetical protein